MKSIIRQPSVGNATAWQLPASRFLRIFDLFRSTSERTFLADALRAAIFDFDTKDILFLAGVTQYLTADAIRATLEFVLSLPKIERDCFEFHSTIRMLPKVEAEALVMAHTGQRRQENHG